MSLSRSTGKITAALMPAAIGAAGALVLSTGWAKFNTSLPASIQTGLGATAAQLALSLGIGMAAGMAFGKQIGTQVAAGAITVTLFSLAQSYMSGAAGGTQIAANNTPGDYTYSGLAGVGAPRMRRQRMHRYVGMNGALPRGINRYVGMNGALPRGINGGNMGVAPQSQAARAMRQMNGYTGPARNVG